MKPKQILTVVLAFFAIGSLAYMISEELKMTSRPNEEISNSVATRQQDEVINITKVSKQENQVFSEKTQVNNAKQKTQLIVYYFHGDLRCPTCHKLETYAKESLETYFPDELLSNKIVWKAVNVDKSQNMHFIRDYNLVTKSVVLSEIADDKEIKWEKLDQIWQKVRDKDEYLNYIRESITEFIAAEDKS